MTKQRLALLMLLVLVFTPAAALRADGITRDIENPKSGQEVTFTYGGKGIVKTWCFKCDESHSNRENCESPNPKDPNVIKHTFTSAGRYQVCALWSAKSDGGWVYTEDFTVN